MVTQEKDTGSSPFNLTDPIAFLEESQHSPKLEYYRDLGRKTQITRDPSNFNRFLQALAAKELVQKGIMTAQAQEERNAVPMNILNSLKGESLRRGIVQFANTYPDAYEYLITANQLSYVVFGFDSHSLDLEECTPQSQQEVIEINRRFFEVNGRRLNLREEYIPVLNFCFSQVSEYSGIPQEELG